MQWTEFFAAQLEREAPISKRTLERVPEGKPDWKPHEKSMALGYLAQLVATMPNWIALTVQEDELDLRPVSGKGYKPRHGHQRDAARRSRRLGEEGHGGPP